MTIDNNLSLNLNQCRYPLITYFSQNYARGFKIQMLNLQNEFRYVSKFMYSETASKLCKISTLLLSVCTVDKSKVEILQNFVAFSEYTNFKQQCQCSLKNDFALSCHPLHIVCIFRCIHYFSCSSFVCTI